ncbi:MAG: hypothetical protein FWD23_17950, partial [Oscillospiraceae bacterium]|nr:hypothetical protein [Oscillospiraceae bacterium]
MPNNVQFFVNLADRHTKLLTDSRENWTNFLSAAGRLYKYPFEEQMMIHAQRPDAQAVAPYDTWKTPMNRYVKLGSKGIALLDNTGGKPKLKYVYDYADTGDGRRNPRRPYIWEMRPEHERLVLDTLTDNYGVVNSGDNIGNVILSVANELSVRYYNDNARDIRYAAEGSYLEDLDDLNVEYAFKEAMAVSTAYALMTRCGIDPVEYFENEDFQPIFDFNSPAAVYALGKAVSMASEEVLRDIEITIKTYEREKAAERSAGNERNSIQRTRGLSDTEYSIDGGQGQAARQIRENENGLSATETSDTLHDIHNAGENVSPLQGNRADGGNTIQSDNDGITGENPAARQNGIPESVDGTHGQSESPSGGNNPERTDLRLSQDENIISDEDINNYLSRGANFADSKYRIYSFFLNDHDTAEKVAFLKDEYGYGGTPYIFADGERGYANAAPSSGIRITKGSSLDPSAEISLTWTNVANRIDSLIENGLYMSQGELDRLPVYERQILGGQILNFFGNLPEDIARLFPAEYSTSVNYWNNAQIIGDTLDNPETLNAILESMRPIIENTPVLDR